MTLSGETVGLCIGDLTAMTGEECETMVRNAVLLLLLTDKFTETGLGLL